MLWVFIIIVAALIIYFFFRSKRDSPSKGNSQTLPKSENVDLRILPEQFVVVDIETTGLNPEKHEIIEIGVVKVNRYSNLHTTFTALIKPDKKKIPKKITEITGITSEMLDRDGENLNDVMDEFLSFAGGLRLVYFNAPFDRAFLSKAVNGIGAKIENPVSYALAMARRAWPGLKSYKLADLAEIGGFSTKGNHRALKDCELTISIYAAVAHKLQRIE